MLALDWNSGGSVSPEKSRDKEKACEWVPHAPPNPSSSQELGTHQSTICWVNDVKMTICSGHYAPATLLATVSSHLTHTTTLGRDTITSSTLWVRNQSSHTLRALPKSPDGAGSRFQLEYDSGVQQGTGGYTESSSRGQGQESPRRAEPEPRTLKQRTLSKARLEQGKLSLSPETTKAPASRANETQKLQAHTRWR